MTLPMTSLSDKSSIVEAFQTELVKHTAASTPCAALMLHRLPQLLQTTEAAAGNPSSSLTTLAVLYAQVHDALLHELEEKQLSPAVSEVRALARAIHHGIIAALTQSSRRGSSSEGGGRGGPLVHTELDGAEAEQLELLRNVSHELRTPLQAILGWVSLLKGGQLQPEASTRALAAIERNAKLQSELITKVLECGKQMQNADETV